MRKLKSHKKAFKDENTFKVEIQRRRRKKIQWHLS